MSTIEAVTHSATITPPITRGGAIAATQPIPDADRPGRAGFLLARAGGRAIRNLNRALEPFGLRSRHYTVLSASAERGGLSQRELGEVLGVDPSAVVALVDDLEHTGLVRRDPHPDDRRTRLVVVTDAGQAMLAETRKLARQVDDGLLAALTPAERATLETLLERLAEPS